ncbi:MAG: MraY family glycosyltransferase [Candidatus Omnitrophica bacterium]|nr:MraY family glycosyltransferase [Candidatus Omnitrophota bacterium]
MIKVFLSALAGSVVFTWAAMHVARKLGVLDEPDQRKVHSKPMPLLGGVAIATAFSLALLLNFHFSVQLKGVVMASLIVMLTGLADDIFGLSASIRLVIQVICVAVIVKAGVYLKLFPSVSAAGMLVNTLITVIWVVGITNAVNFIDGADGLAAGLAGIAGLAFFLIAYQTGQVYFAFLNVALVGACLGFLVFNFHPARIFLGDAGSGFLGFLLASLAVMGDWAYGDPVAALSIPLLILAVPIFDIVYITGSRIYFGKVKNLRDWIEYVGKDHLHHRLVHLGFTQRQMVFFIYLVSMVFALGALAIKNSPVEQSILLVIQGVIILGLISVLMIAGEGKRARMGNDDNAQADLQDGRKRG